MLNNTNHDAAGAEYNVHMACTLRCKAYKVHGLYTQV